MNTTKLPGFTAEDSLVKAGWQHQTDGWLINSPAQSVGTIYPALIDTGDGDGVDCDTCVGAECVGCLEKWARDRNRLIGPGGGGGDPCLDKQYCSPCVSSGPNIFSPGRQFCITQTCSQTFKGCQCQVLQKGFIPCRPLGTGGLLSTAR